MTVVLATPPFLQFMDANGNPLAGGLIYTYAAGTTTPKATYTDQGGLTTSSNPIVLDSAGRATWFIEGAYKYIVKDSLGNTIKTTDNVTSFSTLADAASAFFQSFSGDGTTTAFTLSTTQGTDSKNLMVFVNRALEAAVANGTFAADTIWTKGAGWTIGAGVATATGAISTAISQTATVTLVQGQAYSVTYTITRSAGGLIPSIGGTNGVERTASGTYSEIIIAGSSQTIAFTGNAFTGTLDNVVINVASTAGFDIINPSAYTLSGTSLTFATAPATGTNNIFVFAPSSLLGAASAAASLAQTYATNALTSQTAAAGSAVSAAAFASAKNKWTFSSTTTMADPGTGLLRFNSASTAATTAIAISDLSANSGNPDVSAWVLSWDDVAGGSIRGTLYIFKDETNFVFYNITGATTDNAGWSQLVVTYVTGNGTISNTDSLYVGFVSAGIVTGGITALTGDVTASGSGSVASTIANNAVTTAKILDANVTAAKLSSGLTSTINAAHGFKNPVINSGYWINQRNASSIADDAYGHDRWYALTQTGNIAVSTLTDVENTTPYMARLTQSQVTAQRMGYAQIIEGKNCKYLRGQQVTLNTRYRCSASQAIRFAVLEWTGTEDTVTSDVVNNWTSGTYTAGNFFLAANLTITSAAAATPSAATLTDYSVTVTLGSSFNNLILFVWTEATAAQNVTLDIGKVQLEKGPAATDFEWRIYSDELQLCQRYLPAYNSASASTDSISFGLAQSSTQVQATIPFMVQARVKPTSITVSNNAHFKVTNGAGSGIALTNLTWVDGTLYAGSVFATVAAGLTTGQGSLFFSLDAAAQILFNGAEL